MIPFKYHANDSITDNIIAMWHTPLHDSFIPEFKSGKPRIKSKLPLTRRTITGEIRTIHIYYCKGVDRLYGFKFYDSAGKCIYESPYKLGLTGLNVKHLEIHLDEGE